MDQELVWTLAANVQQYGLPVLGLLMVVSPLGLPVPVTALVVAAGALARQGLFEWPAAAAVTLAAIVAGDSGSFWVGRLAGQRAESFVRKRRPALWEEAQWRFQKYGAMAVYLNHWLFSALDTATDLIAGGSDYSFGRFLFWDVAGRVTWIALFGGLGFTFSGRWQTISAPAQRYTTWLGLLAAAALVVAYMLRRKHVAERRA